MKAVKQNLRIHFLVLILSLGIVGYTAAIPADCNGASCCCAPGATTQSLEAAFQPSAACCDEDAPPNCCHVQSAPPRPPVALSASPKPVNDQLLLQILLSEVHSAAAPAVYDRKTFVLAAGDNRSTVPRYLQILSIRC